MKKKEIIPFAVLVGAITVLAFLVYAPLNKSNAKPEKFVVEEGDSSAKVARLLAEQGFIRSRYLFIGYTILTGKERAFKAGTYALSPMLNIPVIVRMFSAGEALPEGELVTTPEGFNAWEIAELLKQKGFDVETSELLRNEGYLFPDSYYLKMTNDKIQMTNQVQNPNDKTKEIIKKLKDNFTEKTKGLAITPQTIIIASILEKEVRKPEDMALVAGIILKRLELGIPLQIDATVAYGACLNIWMSQVQRACDVAEINLVENIRIDSPYNTYARKGLPAGPISNPGIKAAKAALNPEASDYLYYLSARDDGRTIFSKTAEEHQRNRRKYLNL